VAHPNAGGGPPKRFCLGGVQEPGRPKPTPTKPKASRTGPQTVTENQNRGAPCPRRGRGNRGKAATHRSLTTPPNPHPHPRLRRCMLRIGRVPHPSYAWVGTEKAQNQNVIISAEARDYPHRRVISTAAPQARSGEICGFASVPKNPPERANGGCPTQAVLWLVWGTTKQPNLSLTARRSNAPARPPHSVSRHRTNRCLMKYNFRIPEDR
jgi:hypothetical protein